MGVLIASVYIYVYISPSIRASGSEFDAFFCAVTVVPNDVDLSKKDAVECSI